MPFTVRLFRFAPVLAAVAALGWHATGAAAQANDDVTPRVTIFDNAASGMVFSELQAYWGFGPDQIDVEQGDEVEFRNPAGNSHPHTVTNIERVGAPFPTLTVVAGNRFDSSPTPATLINPGQTFVLDTSKLEPGNYAYFCKLHTWMLGVLTVNEPTDSSAAHTPHRRLRP